MSEVKLRGRKTSLPRTAEAWNILMVEMARRREVAGRIKQARTNAGYTQEKIARLLHVTARAYQQYESLQRPARPSLETLEEIARLTGVSRRWLEDGDQDREELRAIVREELHEVEERLDSLLHRVLRELDGRLEDTPD